jgi:hypothetical protein
VVDFSKTGVKEVMRTNDPKRNEACWGGAWTRRVGGAMTMHMLVVMDSPTVTGGDCGEGDWDLLL